MKEQRDAVAVAVSRGLSERRASRLIGVPRSSTRYRAVIRPGDADLLVKLRQIKEQYPRFGVPCVVMMFKPDSPSSSPPGRKRPTIFVRNGVPRNGVGQNEKGHNAINGPTNCGSTLWTPIPLCRTPWKVVHVHEKDGLSMISAWEALERLRAGNRRFVSEESRHDALSSAQRRNQLTEGQEPFAAILGCSDSRVPVEIVFDQGLGDLFVIRVAGNIVAPSQTGSVEFTAERFGTRLVVVLGHSRCGAVQATIEQLQHSTENRSPNLQSIVAHVRPSVEALLATDLRHDPDALLHQAVRANIRASANHLRHGSRVIEQLIQSDGLLVVGAEYSLETGIVDFFDGVPDGD